MLLITNDDVVRLLSMEQCLAAAEESTRRLANGLVTKWDGTGRNVEIDDDYPHKFNLRLAPVVDLVDEVAILRMLSYVGTIAVSAGATRQVTVSLTGTPETGSGKIGPPHSSERSGLLHMFDLRTGALQAVFQERDLQVMRVGAVGGLNTQYLARSDAHTVGLIGAGWMARSQLLAQCLVRPIARAKVFSLHPETRAAFASEMEDQLGIEIEPVASAEEAVRGSDIVIAATSTTRPVLDASWVEAGAHVHAVSGADYDADMVRRADVIAWTSPPTSSSEASRGDAFASISDAESAKLAARAKGSSKGYREAGWAMLNAASDKRVFLSDLIEGRGVGRTDDRQVTFSPSPAAGSASMPRFCVLLPMVYRAAHEQQVGHELPDAWFRQEASAYPRYRLR